MSDLCQFHFMIRSNCLATNGARISSYCDYQVLMIRP